jgi:hypothetical protein
MKRSLLSIGALVCACTLGAQTRIDLRTQGKGVDFADAASTRPAKIGSALPATCVIGELFFLTTAPTGKNLYGCVSTNVWSAPVDGVPDWTNQAGKVLTSDGTGAVWAGPGGDITGTVGAVTVKGIRGRNVSSTAPFDGQTLIWSSVRAQWEPAAVTGTGEGQVASVAGKTGAVTLEFDDLTDCKVTRASHTLLTVADCKATFPNKSRVAIPSASIAASAGEGTVYIYITSAGVLTAGTSGTLDVTCVGCADAGTGVQTDFPADVIRVWSFPTSAAAIWAASGTDERGAVPALLQSGTGVIISEWNGVKTISADTATLLSKTTAQAGTPLLCDSTSPADVYTCTLTPMLTAYTKGQTLALCVTNANTGAATVDIDGLGPKSIRLSDGITDLSSGKLSGCQSITYDGTVFRLAADGVGGAGGPGGTSLSGTTSNGIPRVIGANAIAVDANSPTYDGNGNLAAKGSIAAGASGSAGSIAIPDASGSVYWTWMAPPVLSLPLTLTMPNAQPSGAQALTCGTPISNVSSCAWTSLMPAVSGSGVVKISAGTPSLVTGAASDCIRVDGSSGACGGGGGGGTGDVTSTVSSSTDGMLPLFNGTTGKQIRPATGTGIMRLNSGSLQLVTGAASDCVKVDGSSGACGGGGGSSVTKVRIREYRPFASVTTANSHLVSGGWWHANSSGGPTPQTSQNGNGTWASAHTQWPGTTAKYANFQWVVPNNWDGSDIPVKFTFSLTSAPTVGSTIVPALSVVCIANETTMPVSGPVFSSPATTTYTIPASPGLKHSQFTITLTAATHLSACSPGSILYGQFTRLVASETSTDAINMIGMYLMPMVNLQ